MKILVKSTFLLIGILLSIPSNAKNKLPFNLDYDSQIKVALLLDTSNSMDGLIDQAKAQLWRLVNELSYAKYQSFKPRLKIALYEYGNNNLNSDEGYIRQILPFSEDLDLISQKLFSLTTNGGNEFCGKVIHTSINQLNWGNNPNDLKLIFIAGNEPFTQGDVNYKVASRLAHNKDISVNTIYCGDYYQGVSTHWKDGADLTHGNYMAINHNLKTVHIPSPYDDTILKLNQKLNQTYVAYGEQGISKKKLQAEQDTNAMRYDKSNAVSRTITKSTHLYKNSSWDLVDAIDNKEIIVENLTEEQIPSELKGKTKDEIKQYIQTKKQERIKLQKEIAALTAKRQNHINEKRKDEATNNLENALLKAIKKQGNKKNYYW